MKHSTKEFPRRTPSHHLKVSSVGTSKFLSSKTCSHFQKYHLWFSLHPGLTLAILGLLGSTFTGSAFGQEISSMIPTTLDRHAMYALTNNAWHQAGERHHGGSSHWHSRGGYWHGGGAGRWHGGGVHHGSKHWYNAGWYGGRYYPAGYYHYWGWSVPTATTSDATATAATTVGSSQNSAAPVYPCQVTYQGVLYQGGYIPGSPCYINVGGTILGISTYRR